MYNMDMSRQTTLPLTENNLSMVPSALLQQPATTRAIDLCCGMGGLSFAAKHLGMSVVAGVDTNLSALKTFKRNFPEAEAIADGVESEATLQQCEELLKPAH